MLSSWTLANFKSIYNSEYMGLAPLTIFCGANSSGKSSIIQSILLVAQTLQTSTTTRPVVLNGHLVRLGSFEDIHSTGAKANTITIGFELQDIACDSVPFYEELASSASFAFDDVFTRFAELEKVMETIYHIDCEFTFSANGPKRDHDLLQLHPRIEDTLVSTYTDQEWLGEKILLVENMRVVRSKQTPRQRLASHPLAKRLYNPKYPPHPSSRYVGLDYQAMGPNMPITSKQTSAQLSHFFPEHLGAIYEYDDEIATQLERAAPYVAEEFLDEGYVSHGANIAKWVKTSSEEHFAPLFPETKKIIIEILSDLATKAEAALAGKVEEEVIEQTPDEGELETIQDEIGAIRAFFDQITRSRHLTEEEEREIDARIGLVKARQEKARQARREIKYDAQMYPNLILQLEKLGSYDPRPTRRSTLSAEEMATLQEKGTKPDKNDLIFTPQDWWSIHQRLPLAAKAEIVRAFSDRAAEIRARSKAHGKDTATVRYSGVSAMSNFSIEYIRKFFNLGVKYLGPLRDEPRAVYPLIGAADPRDVGLRGEHTAAVLQVHRNTKVEYIPSHLIASGQEPTENAEVPLFQAVQEWLDYFGVATDLKSIDSGNLGHRLKVSSAGSSSLHDLTHVGVGVSQVLPILVMAFLAKRGSTLIFEQPELHLHPRVQTRLADFFASMTLSGRQCIIETHSEYIINRLRYLTAVSDSESLRSRTLVYFVEKEEGRSTFRRIKINRFGVIDDWPRGFFDESEEIAAAIVKATLSKRRREQGTQNA